MPRITKRLVEAAEVCDKDYIICDDDLAGFAVRELLSGRRSADPRPPGSHLMHKSKPFISRNSTIATRNISDFEGGGIQVIDSWKS